MSANPTNLTKLFVLSSEDLPLFTLASYGSVQRIDLQSRTKTIIHHADQEMHPTSLTAILIIITWRMYPSKRYHTSNSLFQQNLTTVNSCFSMNKVFINLDMMLSTENFNTLINYNLSCHQVANSNFHSQNWFYKK